MDKSDNQKLREATLEVINKQIRDNEPPETRETLVRLQAEGFSEQEALKLIGYVVISEVFTVLKEKRRYDKEKYISALKALPKLPWENKS